MAEKVTTMVLNVDLQCCRCNKKVKKVLSKFPQIRDPMYDEQANTVTITVVCCNPEEIRDKICCKGGECIKSIEIKPPPKPNKKPPELDPMPAEPEKKLELNHTPTVNVVCCSPEKIEDKICGKCGECINGIEIKPPPKPKIADEKCESTGTPIGSCCGCGCGCDRDCSCGCDRSRGCSCGCDRSRGCSCSCGCDRSRGCDRSLGCCCGCDRSLGCCCGCDRSRGCCCSCGCGCGRDCGRGCGCGCGCGRGCGSGCGYDCGCSCDSHHYCYASKETPPACSFM